MATRQAHLIPEYQAVSLGDLLADLASDAPLPAGGSAAAAAAALAAATLAKATRRSRGQLTDDDALLTAVERLREQLARLVTADAVSYADALEARRQGGEAATAATAAAAGPPARVAAAGAEVARLAADVAERGRPEVRPDALTALRLAAAAALAAADIAIADDPVGPRVPPVQAAAVTAREALARIRPAPTA